MVTTSSAENVLKSYYLDVIGDTLDNKINPFFAAIKKTTSDVWGKDVRKIVRYGANGGVGAGTEDGNLPKASGNRHVQLVASLKNLYGTIEITDKALRASANNEGAFVNLLNDEIDGLLKSSEHNFGRMLFGDGTGKVATLIGAAADAEYGMSPGPNHTYRFDNCANLEDGMIVDVIMSTGSRVATAARIYQVDKINNTAKIAGSYISYNYCGVYLQGSSGLELTGLEAIFSAEKLYGVNRNEHVWMRPTVLTEFGKMTESKLLRAIDDVEEKSGSNINFIICSRDVRRTLFESLAPYRKTEMLDLEGGFRALSVNGIPVVVDKFCPKGTMYLLNTNDFSLHQLCDWQWLSGEDGSILKQVAGKPVYTATLVKYAELICSNPGAQGKITGITDKDPDPEPEETNSDNTAQ